MRYAALAILAALAACGDGVRKTETPPPSSPASTQEPDGTWVKARRVSIERPVHSTGSLAAHRSSLLSAQVSGRVDQVLVDVGDAVKAGKELVLLDRTLFKIEVDQRKADLDAAQVALDEAELNFTRMKNLFEKPQGEQPSVPRKLFDDAKARRDAAAAKLRQEQEKLKWAEQRLKETVIVAPYEGVITRKLVDPGESVLAAPATPMVEIEDVGTLDLEFALPQDLMSRVSKGMKVTFEVEGVAGGPFAGEISTVFPQVDRESRSFRNRVLIANGKGMFKPGLLVQVTVSAGGIDAIVVPKRAVTRSAGNAVVTTRSGSRTVELGVTTGGDIEVAGLKEGDEVFVPAETPR